MMTATPLCAADPTGTVPSDDVIARRFADAIARSSAQDAHSPDTLNSRLGLAQFLAKAAGGECSFRLRDAQQQLEMARAGQSDIAIPFAVAREAAVEYQIHVGRAACGSDAALRTQEWRAALDAARRAVDLYRDELDAVSMATMQYNVGVAYHQLGEDTAALAALQAAIGMDREYGFRDDASDNYRLLLQWRGQPAGPDAVAAQMQNFPQRSTTLSFGWVDGTADVTLTLDYAESSGGGTLNLHGRQTAERRVERQAPGWTVSFAPGTVAYEIRQWPKDESLVQAILVPLIRTAVPFHDFALTATGEFGHSIAAPTFASILRSGVDAVTAILTRDHAPARLTRQIRDESERYGGSIEALVSEAYNMETGTWVGATLDQGVWYEMSVPVSLPVAPQVFVTHQVEFAFTRRVPCTTGSAEQACVEIVMRATPDPRELEKFLANASHRMGLGPRGALGLSSITTLRLVTDPATLQWYDSDVRRYAYWSSRGARFDHSVMEYERIDAVSAPGAVSEP